MPSTVSKLFDLSNTHYQGVVSWGKPIPTTASGVYVISMARNPESHDNLILKAPLDNAVIENWLKRVPSFELDRISQPEAVDVLARLGSFWLSDENILYVGKATNLRNRVGQYYRTPLGDAKPHAGGHWIKTLSILPNTFVHYGVTATPVETESLILSAFVENVSKDTKLNLPDSNHPFPFANLEYPQGTRKPHGIGKSKL